MSGLGFSSVLRVLVACSVKSLQIIFYNKLVPLMQIVSLLNGTQDH